MHIIADLHIHSKYSRAVSPRMDLNGIGEWASYKGIDLIATGDWTHPMWFREIATRLQETSPGIYELKNPNPQQKHKVRFILSVEIASIFSQGGKGRRIHNVVLAPSVTVVEKINKEFVRRGTNIMSDGRPITGMSAKEMLAMILSIDERCMLIPAHIWTPWFSMFGSKSGFDSIEECFGPEGAKHIYAIETGLSCYDEETEVLTNNGWKKFTEINYDDKLCTLNLTTHRIEYQNPTKIHNYDYEGKMYRLKTKRVDLLVTPNHKLLYSRCNFRKKPILELKEAEFLFKKSKRLKKDGEWRGDSPIYFTLPEVQIKHGSRFYSGYRTKKQKKIPIRSWLKFFGFWTAEGWTTEGKNGDYNVCVCNTGQQLLREMEKILNEMGYKTTTKNNVIRVRDYQLFHYLRQFGKCSDKYFPIEIKLLSKELLQILLEYYIKGDGHMYGRNGKGLSATTTSIRLRDDLQEIALKMGISAYYKLHNKKGTPFKNPGQKYKKIYKQRNDSWVVFFIRKNIHTIMPSLIKRGGHIEKWVDFKGKVYCASVPNHTLYIRRNGVPLWCGNSDPIMNWQIKELETRSIISSSDAHSGPKLAREATVFIPNNQLPITNYSYDDITDAIKQKPGRKLKIGYTIEFFPEEGKYHWTGHRTCNIKYSPKQEKEQGVICPVCKQPLTVGVESRVIQLSHQTLTPKDLLFAQNKNGLTFVEDKEKKRRPFVSIIPLQEIFTELEGGSPVKGERSYLKAVNELGTEFDILLHTPYEKIEQFGGVRLKEAIEIIRTRQAYVDPGYDGVFGVVKIFKDEKKETDSAEKKDQPALF